MFQYTQLRKEVRGVHIDSGFRILTARIMLTVAMLTMVMLMMMLILLMPRCERWMVRQVSPPC